MIANLANHNGANIRYVEANKWQGLDTPPQEKGFCRFTSDAFGIRALARILIAYQDSHECHTVTDLISRYAPAADLNPTPQYIKNVCQWTGFDPMQALDVHTYAHMRPLVEAIIRQEQGTQPYSDMQYNEGLRLAGVVRPIALTAFSSAAKDPKAIAGAIVGTAATVQAVISPIADVWDTISRMGIDPRIIVWGASIAIGIVGAWFVIEWIQRRRQGLA